jgi:hypothetical protein
MPRAVRLRTFELADELLGARTACNGNATSRGRGVAELLHSLAGYGVGAGLDVRWTRRAAFVVAVLPWMARTRTRSS